MGVIEKVALKQCSSMRRILNSLPKKNRVLKIGFYGAATGQWADIFGLENFQPLSPYHKSSSLLGQQLGCGVRPNATKLLLDFQCLME